MEMSGKRGRPSQCLISETEFKDILLEQLVDADGLKVSLRTVFNQEEFMVKTGYYNIKTFKDTGEYRMISPGTISYIINKLNLYEWELYQYHKYISKRIPKQMSFEQFSRAKNKDYKDNRWGNTAMKRHNNLKTIAKDKLVWVLNSVSKKLKDYPELDVEFASEYMSYDSLEDYSDRMRRFMNDDQAYVELFRERISAFRQKYVDRKKKDGGS